MTQPTVGLPAPDAVVKDTIGRDVCLSDFWRLRPTVLVFLRHFGCPLCRRHLVEMQRHLDQITRRGAQVIAIGQGSGDDAREFCSKAGIAFPCLGDPGRASYRKFALPRGGWREIIVEPLLEGLEGIRRIVEVDVRGTLLPSSDWFQLGGVAIVDREGILRWTHRARHAADLAPMPAILAALDVLASEPGVTTG